MVDPVEVGVKMDHPYADTLSDSSLPHTARPLRHSFSPTPSLDSISDSTHAEYPVKAFTLKDIVRQVCLLAQLMVEWNCPPQVPPLEPMLPPLAPMSLPPVQSGLVDQFLECYEGNARVHNLVTNGKIDTVHAASW